MKILWINPSFSDYRVPFYEHLNKLSEGNFHVVFSQLRMDSRVIEKAKLALGDNAHCLTTDRFINIGPKEVKSTDRPLRIPFPQGLWDLIKSIEADVVIHDGFFQWAPWALRKSFSSRIPFVIAYERTFHTERVTGRLRTLYRKIIDKFVSGYLVNGILTEEYLTSGLGVKNKPIVKHVMAADSSHMSEMVNGLRKNQKREGLNFLFSGRMIELKGISQLLNAWKLHSQRYSCDKLILVGDGPLLEKFKRETDADPSIEFRGYVRYDDMPLCYESADVFVMPTLQDNWSLVVPEAMACGLPIACSIYNGCYPELVKNGENGFIFNPLDLVDTCNALAAFHRSDLHAMGDKSQQIEADFTPQKAAERSYALFKQLCHE